VFQLPLKFESMEACAALYTATQYLNALRNVVRPMYPFISGAFFVHIYFNLELILRLM